MNAANAAGGIDIDAGTGGVDVLTTGGVSIDAAGASNVQTSGTNTLTIGTQGDAQTIISSAGTGTDAVDINATAGSVDIDGDTNVDIASNTGDVTLTSGDEVLISSTNQTTIDGAVVSIDGTDNTNLTMTANDAADKALTIDGSNAGAGSGYVNIIGEERRINLNGV